MRLLALACDYDGTLAHHGTVPESTIGKLEELVRSGRKLIMVTGRELEDLQRVFSRLDLFHAVVAENGGLLYLPSTKESRPLCEGPDPNFVEALRSKQVEPLSVGHTIVATWEPHEKTVLETIQELGLELQVIFNKGAVMILPTGVNKGTGLALALKELQLSPRNCVGVGDAENDHAFLSTCELAAAVANALPSVKERSDIVIERSRGEGVEELIDRLLSHDLQEVLNRSSRHTVPIGEDKDGRTVVVRPALSNLLIAGPSGSGKSTAATTVLEGIAAAGYQFCVIDPEGDYLDFPNTLTIGDADHAPDMELVMAAIRRFDNVTVNLLGVAFNDRPLFFAAMLPRLQEIRAALGRPHLLVFDEAHHLIPKNWAATSDSLPNQLGNTILITVHPDEVARPALQAVNMVIAVGPEPAQTLRKFAEAVGHTFHRDVSEEEDSVACWFIGDDSQPFHVRLAPSTVDRRRHLRKYAVGDVQEKAFYFRGPGGRLNLRAQNLSLFVQIAEGVDDETWDFHLQNGDYSEWIRRAIKDDELALRIAAIEHAKLPASDSRQRVKQAIGEKYVGIAS